MRYTLTRRAHTSHVDRCIGSCQFWFAYIAHRRTDRQAGRAACMRAGLHINVDIPAYRQEGTATLSRSCLPSCAPFPLPTCILEASANTKPTNSVVELSHPSIRGVAQSELTRSIFCRDSISPSTGLRTVRSE